MEASMLAGCATASAISPLDRLLTMTLFRDEYANTKQELATTLRDLMPRLSDTTAHRKDALPWLKMAKFGETRSQKNCLRIDENVAMLSGLEMDYDGEIITIAEAAATLKRAGIAAIIYASPSHTAAKPRWRVLCPLSVNLKPEARAALAARINGLFGGTMSHESFTLSQSYYYGKVVGSTDHQVVAIEGRAIDLADDLDGIATGPKAKIKAEPPPSADRPAPTPRQPLASGTATAYGEAALDSACTEIMSASDGHKHHTVNKEGYCIGGLVSAGHIAEGDAWSALQSSLKAILPYCKDKRAAEKTLQQSFSQGMAAPRDVPELEHHDRRDDEATHPADGFLAQLYKRAAESAAKAEHLQTPEGQAEAEQAKSRAIWWSDDEWDEQTIPVRSWVVPGYLMRGAVTCLAGAGGAGKSSLLKAWDIALCLGVPFNGFKPQGRFRVLSYNVEDDLHEERRRLSASLRQFDRTPRDLKGWLRLTGPSEIGTLVVRDAKTKQLRQTDAMDTLEKLIAEFRPDVVILDPLVELHNDDENDNNALRGVIAHFRALGVKYNCAIVIACHVRKGTIIPGDMDSIRGAGSIPAAARVCFTVCNMGEDDASAVGIGADRRKFYFRVDSCKANYAPPGEAEWFEKHAYDLDNGESIMAALPWSPPKDVITLAVLEAIKDAVCQGTGGEPYTFATQDSPRSFRKLCAIHGVTTGDGQKSVRRALEKVGFEAVKYRRASDRREASGIRSPDHLPDGVHWADLPDA